LPEDAGVSLVAGGRSGIECRAHPHGGFMTVARGNASAYNPAFRDFALQDETCLAWQEPECGATER
jgi:hypothetical protein